MERWLYEKISAITEEEQKVLAGLSIDVKQYAEGKDFVITDERINGAKKELGIRIHSRFARFPTHSHNFLEIMAVVSGSITHIIDEKAIYLNKGDVLLMNRHVSHSIEKTGKQDVGANLIVADSLVTRLSPALCNTVFSELIEEHMKNNGAPIYLHFRAGRVKTLENLIENLISELSEPCGCASVGERTLSLFLDYLSIYKEKLLLQSSDYNKKIEERKQKILFYIKNNYQTATLTELSEQFFLSPPHLSAKIKEYFGKGFKELLSEERMERAAELITSSALPIVRILRSVGYESESYFHKEFQRRFGKTPMELRKTLGFNIDLTSNNLQN